MRTNLLRITLLASVLAASGGLSTTAEGVSTANGVTTAAAAQPSVVGYEIEDLGTLPGDTSSVAMGINEAGDVVGWSQGSAGTRAFVWTEQDGMTALPGPAGRPFSWAYEISDTGTVAGVAATGWIDIGQAVRWQNGLPERLGTLGTGDFSEARGVNAAGVTVGSSYVDGGNILRGIHAFRFDDASGLVDLTPTASSSQAQDINDNGQIAGWREGRAFRLTGSTFLDLGVPPGFLFSYGYAINNSGQVAGHTVTASGNIDRLWRYTDGVGMVLFGPSFTRHNRAWGINSAGDVVGQIGPSAGGSGFVFTDADGLRQLNSLVDPAEGWFIHAGSDINDSGQIAAVASGPGGGALRLTPTDVVRPPAAPSNLFGGNFSPTDVLLNWNDNANNEAGFTVQRRVGSGAFARLAQVEANVATYTDTTVRPGKVYRYRVRAFNDAGVSPWSNTIRVRTR